MVGALRCLIFLFYDSVQKDYLIGPIFYEKIGNNWTAHLERMYRFWQTILLEEHTYTGSPFPPHKHLPVEKAHFNRWMEIFTINIDSQFTGALAEEAKLRAKNMAEMFFYKIEYFRNGGRNFF